MHAFPIRRLAALAATLSLSAGACGSGYVVTDAGPKPPPPPPAAPKVPDAYGDHRGQHVKTGLKFRLAAKPIAVDGPNLVIGLTKVDWSTMTSPSGKEIREATVNLVLMRGEDSRQVMIGQKDEKTAMGARIQVLDAGEDYNRQRMVYEPWVELIVDSAAQ